MERIDWAIGRLTAWGVSMDDDSRLHKARAVLQHAVETGELVPSHRGDLLGLRALELAFDYAAIVDTLPSEPISSLRRDLRDSLIGDIDPPEDTRGPLQLQSQAIVRAVFVRAGLSPEHPRLKPRLGISNPDLVLPNGVSRYAIEAKRPQTAANILPRFRDGSGQVASHGLPGGVFVDAADAVGGLSLEQANALVSEAGASIMEEVFTPGSGHKAGYGHIVVSGVYARVAWTSEDAEDHAMVSVHTAARIAIFASARNTLGDHRAKWIRSSFQDGLSQLTAELERPTAGNE